MSWQASVQRARAQCELFSTAAASSSSAENASTLFIQSVDLRFLLVSLAQSDCDAATLEVFQRAVSALFHTQAGLELLSCLSLQEFFLSGLLGPDEQLRYFTLRQLASVPTRTATLKSVLNSVLFRAALSRVFDESTLVSDQAVSLITSWVQHSEARPFVIERLLSADVAAFMVQFSDPHKDLSELVPASNPLPVEEDEGDEYDEESDESDLSNSPVEVFRFDLADSVAESEAAERMASIEVTMLLNATATERFVHALDLVVRISVFADAMLSSRETHISNGLPSVLSQALLWLRAQAHQDPLMAMTIVETLAPLSNSAHGLSFLLTEFQLSSVMRDLLSSHNPFISVTVLKWISEIALSLPKFADIGGASDWFADISNLVSTFVPSIAENFTTYEHGLNAISALGCSAFGLRYLSVQALNLLSDAVTHRNDAIRAASMHGLSSLFGSQPDGADQKLFQSLFIHVGACNDTTTMQVLMGYLKTPFDDLRNAAFRLLSIAARFEWGVQAMQSAPSFFEWLLNRNTETTLVGSDWKFTIVQVLCANRAALQCHVSAEFQTRLFRFEREGRFFAHHIPRVMTEDMSA